MSKLDTQTKTKGTKRRPYVNLVSPSTQSSYGGAGIRGDLHVMGKIQVKGIDRFGGERYVALVNEAVEYGCTVERNERGRQKYRYSYIFTSCDTGAGGVECMTLDEVDEELDNFRG